MTDKPKEGLSWNFPRTFWFANGAELFERAAYYGMAIVLAVYLTDQIGFDDVWTGWVAGSFASVLYLMPTFTGLLADKIGFRRALLMAFSLLTVGYILLGVAGLKTDAPASTSTPAATQAVADSNIVDEAINNSDSSSNSKTSISPSGVNMFNEFTRKAIVIIALLIIMFGGSVIKPVISGTVAVCSDEANRARAFSIFYAIVNIGSFTGKSFAAPLRIHLGVEYINFYSALMAMCALLVIAFGYRNTHRPQSDKTLKDAVDGLVRVVCNLRFMCLILIVAGFWAIQHQLYASMPKYILRMLGDDAKPEWLANINPAVVVLLVVPITHLVRKMKPVNSIMIALMIIPLSSLTISLSPMLQQSFGGSVPIGFGMSLHPITMMVIIGIGLQGLAECFLSPKFLEFASRQAPEGEVGLYMGYSHLSSFFAYAFGFIISGYLLDWYCPDPKTLPGAVQQARRDAIANSTTLPAAYEHAHYIWYVFAGIGVMAFCALIVFNLVTRRIDKKRSITGT